MKVLGIELENIVELIRFNINVKQEKVGLLAYRENNVFHVGFYYPSFLKKFFISFLYVSLESPPHEVYSYNPEPVNGSYLSEGSTSSHMIINVPVAFIETSPHTFADPEKIKDNRRRIKVRDLKSLLYIAGSTYFESSDFPYIWYDISKNVYVLGVHSSGDSESLNLYFYLDGEYIGPYISVSNDFKELNAVESIKDISKSYFLVVRAKELPYLLLKNSK